MSTPVEYTLTLDTGPMQLSLRQLNSEVARAERTLKELDKTSEANAISAGRFLRGLRDVSITLASLRFVAMDLHQVFLGLPTAVAKTSAEFERMTKLMEGMSTEADAARRKLEGVANVRFIQDLAMRAPFDVRALTDAFVKMKAVGIDPTAGALQGLVDGVAKFGGNADVLHRASIALQQMAGKGTISMEELRQQLGEAMPNAIQLMAQALGVGVQELTDKVSKGQVGARAALERFFATLQAVNRGAAQEMMSTATGMFEQLKTQWELLKNEIGNAENTDGSTFMSEVKRGMQDVIDLMKSPEMRKIGVSLGESMATGARMIAGSIESIVQNIDTVKNALTALAAYMTVKGVIFPAADALKQKSAEWTQIYERNTAAIKAALTQQKLTVVEQLNGQIAAIEQGITRERALAAQKKAMRDAELAEMRAYGAEALALEKRIAGIEAAGGREGGRFVSAASIAQMRADAATWNQMADEKMRAAQRLNYEIAQMNGTILTNQNRLQEVAGKMREAEKATTSLSLAQKALQGTIAAGSMVFNALGGWIGVITTALLAGIWAWDRWGDSAEKAAQRALRAKMGVSTAEDLEKQTEIAERLRKQIAEREGHLQSPYVTQVLAGRDPKAVEAMKANLDSLKSQLKDSETQIVKMRQSLMKEAERVELNEIDRSIKERQGMVDRFNQSAINELSAKHKAELKATKLQGDALKELQQRQAKEANALLVQQSQRTINLLDTQLKEQKRLLTNAEDAAKKADPATQAGREMLAQVEARRAAVTELERQIAAEEQRLPQLIANRDEAFIFGGGKKKKDKSGTTGPINTPMETLLTKLKADNVALQEQVRALTDGLVSLDELQRQIDQKLNVRFEGGAYKYRIDGKEVNATKAEVEALKKEMLNNELGKLGVKNLEKFQSDMRAMSDDYQRALAIIADPASSQQANSGLAKFLELIKKVGPELELAQQGLAKIKGAPSLQSIIDQMTVQKATIDAAGMIQRAYDERMSLEEQLFTTEEQRIQTRIQRREELARREYEAMRGPLVSAAQGMADVQERQKILDQIAAMDEAYHAASVARARLAAREMETPLEQLARQWADTTQQMRQATASWAQSGADAFIQLATTGKMQFRSLTISILNDLARIQLQKAASGLLNMAVGAFTSWLTGGGSAYGGAQGSIDTGTAGVSLTSPVDVSMPVATPIPFANGGIMTQFGELPLRKYSQGGIANSPQLALYGEGRMNEAYVPLPDGRTIPVTLTGGGGEGGQTVVINIEVNEAQGTSHIASTQGNPNAVWQNLANRVKDMVRDELMVQRRPGGLLNQR